MTNRVYHLCDQLERLCGGMKFGADRLVYFEHSVPGPVLTEIVRPILEPAVQDRFVAVIVVASSQYELLFDPDQVMLEGESGGLEGLNETDSSGPAASEA